jgi:hypothetical protein
MPSGDRSIGVNGVAGTLKSWPDLFSDRSTKHLLQNTWHHL